MIFRSVASSYFSGLHYGGHSGGPGTGIGHYYHGSVGGHHLNRLEVGADVHTTRKKFSLSSERLSETVSLSERSATVSLAEEGGGNSAAASTRALAGSLLAYKVFLANFEAEVFFTDAKLLMLEIGVLLLFLRLVFRELSTNFLS